MYFSEFELDCLTAHNKYRADHGSSPMVLDCDLCKYAQEWANELAKHNILQHRSNNSCGENIFMTMASANVRGQDAVQRWYEEVQNHNFKSEAYVVNNTGHFSQVVWRACKRLGVGMARSGMTTYVVANYDPPGNYRGEYKKNVLPLVFKK